MSSVIPLTFNSVELCVVTINEKTWTHAKEAFRTLEYNKKTSKTVIIIKAHDSPENYCHMWQLIIVSAASTSMNWLNDSQKYGIYISEEGIIELLVES